MGDTHRRFQAAFAVVAIAAAALIAGIQPATAVTSGANTTAGELFKDLRYSDTVVSGYNRDYFTHWTDADGDGCSTREEVLIEESLVPVTKGSGCTITAGQWLSRYDGAIWTAPADVDIDHIVPLAEAWRSGAAAWTSAQREAFANDLGFAHSLEAVTDNVNQSKGDQDPATWMPALDQCQYAVDWVSTKWRWNLSVNYQEYVALLPFMSSGTACSTTAVNALEKADTTPSVQLWPLYKIVYDSTIFELVRNADGSQTPVALTYAKWRDVYGMKQPQPIQTDFVKYLWSKTVYAVTFWPGGENAWMWTPLSYQQWSTAGRPAPRLAGWIKGSYYYQWGTSSEIFVEGADGVNHKLTYQEWANSNFRAFERRASEGFLKLSWANDMARMSNLSTGVGRPVGYAEWQEEAFPAPAVQQRITGDQFYKYYGNDTVWYAGPSMNRPVNYAEWQAAGSPAPSVRNAPPSGGGGGGGGTTPGNPGNTVNCTDFSTQAAAQQWFDTYYPYYGDVAGLDSDGDRIACETLP